MQTVPPGHGKAGLIGIKASASSKAKQVAPANSLPFIDSKNQSEVRSDMRILLAFVAVLFSAAAFAQSSPPMAGDKPPVQAKPHKAAPGKPQSIAVRLQECLDIDDGTKGRLECYDAVIPPAPKPKAMTAKGVADCRFAKEEDERLACFNGFAESIPRLPRS
jgi:hypothetical protein